MRITKTYITALFALGVFTACEDENKISSDDAHLAYIYAEIAPQKEAASRGAAVDSENGTYTAFGAGDAVGIYALGPLYNKSGINDTPVKNTTFTLGTNGRWQDDAKLIWNASSLEEATHADIYGYYPYQDHQGAADVYKNGGYNIFKETNILEDVLMAERTTVQYDNPAIFLTFKHRFALLKIKLGTGMEGSPAIAGAVSAIMNLGIEDNAKIDNQELGQMRLTEKVDGIKEFKPIKESSGFYYVIVPVEGPYDKDNPSDRFVSDSLQVTHIKVDDKEFPLDNTFAPRMNTIYSLTVHKGDGGSVSVVMGGIEEWGDYRYLSNVREEGGIYWASDLVNLQNALNAIAKEGRVPDQTDEATLASYGSWDEDEQCFVFPVMRNINMNDYASGNRSCCITEFYGILDGRGYSINGLDITGAGLIGTLKEGATVKDLELKNTTVNSTSDAGTGALVGHAEEGTTLHNCSVTGTSAVKGGDNTGGLVGSGNPTMDRCSSNADVEGGSNTGGLIGSLTAGGSIDQSYTTGTITSTTGDNVGGLAGSAAGPITNSHAGCDVTGQNNVGGLVGNTTASIDGCTATGYIKGKDIVGGLAGSTTTTVNNSGANGTVEGTGIAGGLIGKHDVNISGGKDVKEVAEITGSYARATVSGGTVGGLIGVATPYKPEVLEVVEVLEKWTYKDENGNVLLLDSTVEIDPSKTAPPVEGESDKWSYYDKGGNLLLESDVEIDPDKTDHTEPVAPVEYKAPKGTEITNCYATNGKALAPNSSEGISYCYQIGTTTSEGGTNAVYTIALPPPTDQALNAIIAALNAGTTDGNPWIKGLVIIDNKSYTLPVLNYK